MGGARIDVRKVKQLILAQTRTFDYTTIARDAE